MTYFVFKFNHNFVSCSQKISINNIKYDEGSREKKRNKILIDKYFWLFR